jgi:hypothetical protein
MLMEIIILTLMFLCSIILCIFVLGLLLDEDE